MDYQFTSVLSDRLFNTTNDLFGNSGRYINCCRVFYHYFGSIPSVLTAYKIDDIKAFAWIQKDVSTSLIHTHLHEYKPKGKKDLKCDSVLFVLQNEIIIDLDEDGELNVLYTTKGQDLARELFDELSKMKRKAKVPEPTLRLLADKGDGLDLHEIKLKKPKLSVEEHYNADLQALHAHILKQLRKPKSGIYLFHGAPGTGKSTYIRYLIHCARKKVIFFPSKLAGNLDAPAILPTLLENPNCILVIEDAEDLLVSRENERNGAMSAILNLTDGLLGEGLHVQIICTFNTHISNIDKALMRKGRLLAMYEFKPLATTKANLLLQKLKKDTVVAHHPMTLAEIYGAEELEFNERNERGMIGFRMKKHNEAIVL